MPSLKDISQKLAQDFGKSDARMIIQHVTGYGAEDLITKPQATISEEQEKQIDQIVERRLAGEPLTRILGCREFWGLEFDVTPDVLDPRPDTETLIEAVLAWVKGNHPDVIARSEATKQSRRSSHETGLPRSLQSLAMTDQKEFRILDLGTGTGCIPISLLSELPQARAVAVDVSEEALKVARRNAEKNGVADRMEFIQSNWFENLEGQKFDLIVSNPPYISDQVIPELDDEVKNHDPILALSGGESGLDCYKIIFSQLNNYFSEGARGFFEIGFDQLESVSRLVDDSNLRLCDSYRDLGGNDRVVEIMRGDK